MKKLFYFNLILNTILYLNINAVLVSSYVLVDDNNLIYLLGEEHDGRAAEDKDQIEILSQILKEREMADTDHLAICIEEPLQFFIKSPESKEQNLKRRVKVTTCLKKESLKKQLKYTSFENIETRLISGAAQTIFFTQNTPRNMLWWGCLLNNRKINLKDLSIRDLINEFLSLKKELKLRRKQDLFIGRAIFKKNIKQAIACYKQFLVFINETNISVNDRLLNIANKFAQEEDPDDIWLNYKRYKAREFIIKMFSYLFDLNLISCINKNCYKKKLIIVGDGHIANIINLLKSKGYFVVEKYKSDLSLDANKLSLIKTNKNNYSLPWYACSCTIT